jgi:putative sigma-54 modulation protein
VRTIVKGKNIEVSEQVRSYTERKVERLGRRLDERTDAIVEFSIEQHRNEGDSHLVELTLVIDGRPLRARAAGPSHQSALDIVLDRAERQAVAQRERPRTRSRAPEEKDLLRQLADGTAEPARERRVVKQKRFAIEPIFEEDAIAALEELGHSFYVFVNAETERIAILYRRSDGNYGLIEPVVGGQYLPGRTSRPAAS